MSSSFNFSLSNDLLRYGVFPCLEPKELAALEGVNRRLSFLVREYLLSIEKIWLTRHSFLAQDWLEGFRNGQGPAFNVLRVVTKGDAHFPEIGYKARNRLNFQEITRVICYLSKKCLNLEVVTMQNIHRVGNRAGV